MTNLSARNKKGVVPVVRVKFMEPCNTYGCRIGGECFIGPFVEIQ